ncbi:nuclear transport factor 2 family protein [Novosphingobium sp. JCM 18896]|uniref:nuclear transport factor 2 family protein n=1 Tax=Novosphingobium sp. JCM 18896 TaxID=2989731 RepID=UPI002222EED7|nr:nuclear transport factor 2 family protein [Novosphingobium sp. JCM 18896]MCW1429959.1 nuclear transport factor 2 family protein [Novosphingobium sp. JCM 18896]
MTEIERLLAIEAIKQVKAKYFYGFDHKDWDLWRREVWAPEGRLEVPEFRPEPFAPFEEVLKYASEAAADQVSVHHGHTPVIDFVSDDEAKVIWAMEDRLFRSKEHPLYDGSTWLHGWGHYHETYVRLPQGWRLLASRLTRLRVEMKRVF